MEVGIDFLSGSFDTAVAVTDIEEIGSFSDSDQGKMCHI